VPVRTRAMLDQIMQKADTFRLTAEYYEVKNLTIVLPTILITALGGMLSFLATSTLVGTDGKQILALCVGLLSTIATVLGSFGQTMAWGKRAESFRGAAQQYALLKSRVEFKQYAQKPLSLTKENEHMDRIRERELSIQWQALIEQEIMDVQKRLPFIPPVHMVHKWTKAGKISSLAGSKAAQDLRLGVTGAAVGDLLKMPPALANNTGTSRIHVDDSGRLVEWAPGQDQGQSEEQQPPPAYNSRHPLSQIHRQLLLLPPLSPGAPPQLPASPVASVVPSPAAAAAAATGLAESAVTPLPKQPEQPEQLQQQQQQMEQLQQQLVQLQQQMRPPPPEQPPPEQPQPQ
jgi:hypothetical protein